VELLRSGRYGSDVRRMSVREWWIDPLREKWRGCLPWEGGAGIQGVKRLKKKKNTPVSSRSLQGVRGGGTK